MWELANGYLKIILGEGVASLMMNQLRDEGSQEATDDLDDVDPEIIPSNVVLETQNRQLSNSFLEEDEDEDEDELVGELRDNEFASESDSDIDPDIEP
ncbi:hypothetical protein AAC387_Pa05g0708 [Persea americana]